MKIKNFKPFEVWETTEEGIFEDCYLEESFETLNDAVDYVKTMTTHPEGGEYIICVTTIIMQPKEVKKALKRMKK